MNCIKLIQAHNLHSSMCTHPHVITCMLLMYFLFFMVMSHTAVWSRWIWSWFVEQCIL